MLDLDCGKIVENNCAVIHSLDRSAADAELYTVRPHDMRGKIHIDMHREFGLRLPLSTSMSECIAQRCVKNLRYTEKLRDVSAWMHS